MQGSDSIFIKISVKSSIDTKMLSFSVLVLEAHFKTVIFNFLFLDRSAIFNNRVKQFIEYNPSFIYCGD